MDQIPPRRETLAVKLDAEIVRRARMVAKRRGEHVSRYLSSLLQYSVGEDYRVEVLLVAKEIAEQEALERKQTRD